MIRTRTRILLLAIGLLFTQASIAAHAFEHPLTAHTSEHCSFCSHGHGLDHSLVNPPAALNLPAAVTDRYCVVAISFGFPQQLSGFYSRAPPFFI